MSLIPDRLLAVVAVSAVGAGLLIMPATAIADDTSDGGQTGSTTKGPAGADKSAAADSKSAGDTGSDPADGATTKNPAGTESVSGAIVRAGSQMVESLAAAAQQAIAPRGVAPSTAVPQPVGAEQSSLAAPVEEGTLVASAARAPASAPAVAAAPAPAPAPAPVDPIADFLNRMMGNTNNSHCGCGWIPIDDDDDPPPPVDPPDDPPTDEYGWGLPIGNPGIGAPGIRRHRFVACGVAVTLPPAPVPPTPVVVTPPELPPPPGGGGGGGGFAPLAFLAGGAPLGGAPGGAFEALPASYQTGLTFETGIDDRTESSNLQAAGALSAMLLAIGGGLLFWRRNAQRQTGRHRTVPLCRVPAAGMWE